MIEHEEWCDDGHDDDCPICRGDKLSAEFIAMIKEAAAAEPDPVMTPAEFGAYLDSLSQRSTGQG